MEDRERVGIGTVVMRNKQYLTAIRPLDGALAMSTMRFAAEVVPRKDLAEIPNRRTKPDTKSLKLATQLVDSMAAHWKPAQYGAQSEKRGGGERRCSALRSWWSSVS